jgi:anti-anti-sigma factor
MIATAADATAAATQTAASTTKARWRVRTEVSVVGRTRELARRRAAATLAQVTALTILDGTSEGVRVFRLLGTIDAATASSVAAALSTAWDQPSGEPVEIDLRGVSFMDSAGLGVLMMARMRARELDRPFRVVSPRPSVERLLRLTGLRDILMNDA